MPADASAGGAVTLDTIRAARERIRDVIYHSPCPYSLSLSAGCAGPRSTASSTTSR